MVPFPDFQLPESLSEAGIEDTLSENQSIPAGQSGLGETSNGIDWDSVTPADFAKRIAFGLRLAAEASRVTLQYFRTDSFRVERKNDRSPVTLADKQAEETVRKLVECTIRTTRFWERSSEGLPGPPPLNGSSIRSMEPKASSPAFPFTRHWLV